MGDLKVRAEKYIKVAQVEYPVDRLERPLKFLTHYGDLEKNLNS